MSVGKDNNILFTSQQKIIKSSQGAFDQAEGLARAELYGEKKRQIGKRNSRLFLTLTFCRYINSYLSNREIIPVYNDSRK